MTGRNVLRAIQLPRYGVSLPFSMFAQGNWVPNPVPLDTTKLMSLAFHVVTNASDSTPFDFCVSNVRFIYTIIEPPRD